MQQTREERMAVRIVDRGRGPELEGTRITVYRVMDYVRAGDPAARIAQELNLSEQEVQEAIECINAHRREVEAAYEAILKRVSQPNPNSGEAGSANTRDELRRRIEVRTTGELAHAAFRAGWPQGIAPLGLPRIRTCPFRHTALHIMNSLRDGSLSESAIRLVPDAATVVGSCTRLWVSMHPPCVPPTVS